MRRLRTRRGGLRRLFSGQKSNLSKRQHRPTLRFESLEQRRLMIATAIGSGTAIEGQPYQLNLAQDYGATSQWKVNWGDGSAIQAVAGTVAQVSHSFADGPSSPVITTELYKPDGKFAGLSPAEISTGADGSVFARNIDGSIYRLDGQTWTAIPLNLTKLAVRNANEIWGLDAAGNVSIWNGTTSTPFGTRQLKAISVAGDGTAFGIDTANVTVMRSGTNWTNISGPFSGAFVKISAGNNGTAVGIDSYDNVYVFSGGSWAIESYSSAHTTTYTRMKDVSIGPTSSIFGVDSNGLAYIRVGRANWASQPFGGLRTISVGPVYIWGIDASTGAVERWDGSTFTRIPVTVTPVAVADAAPTVSFNATTPAIAGQTFNPQMVVQDAGTDTLSYLAINWGDGSPTDVIPASQAPSHRYASTGNYSLSAFAFNEDNPLPPATATTNGTVVVEAEQFANSVAVGSSTWQRFALGNQSTVRGVELSAAPSTSYGNSTAGSRLDYQVQFDRSGVQYAWLRMRSPFGAAAVQLGLNGVPFSYGGQGVSSSSNQWQWVRTVLGRTGDANLSVTTTLGSATLNIWAMNGKVQIDQLLLTPDSAFIPTTTQPEIRNLAAGYASSVTNVIVQNGYVVPSTGAAIEGQPYLLNLTQNYGSGSQWKINWGDGSAIQTVAGNIAQVSHTFADGPSSPVITTELYKPDGKYAGLSPAEVSVGIDGSVFARNADGGIYRLDGQTWTRLPINFSRFSVRTVNEIWGLDELGNVSIWNGTSTTPFLGRQFANISIADDGWAWGIDTAGVAARAYGATTWTSYPAYFLDLEAAPGGGAYGINTLGNLYYFNLSNAQWTSFPGNLKDLSHSADGSLIGVNSANNIYRWNGNGTWTQLTWGNLASISVHNATDIWGLDVNGAVAHWNGAALTRVPTTITNVSVANAAPNLQLISSGPVIATEPFRPQLRSNDQGSDTLSSVAINWGDGSPVDIITAAQQPSHRYAVAGSYVVTAAAFDEDNLLPPAGTAAAVVLASGYAVIGTTAVVTAPSSTPQLPIATFDSGTVKQGTNVLVPVLDNDFDPNGETISLVGLQLSNSTATPVSTLTTTGVTAAVENGAIRLTATTSATVGKYEFDYFIQDAVGNRVRQVLAVNLLSSTTATPPANSYNSGGDVATANAKFVTRTDVDFTLPSIGIPVDVTRYYDSQSTEDQGFGAGWTYRYGSRLILNTNNTDFVWVTPEGDKIQFVTGTTSGGITNFTVSNSLNALNSSTATRQTIGSDLVTRIRTKFGDVCEFRHSATTDPSARLVRLEDRNGNAHAVIYDQGAIQRVDDVTTTTPITRLTFTTAGGKITAITDQLGRTWNYQYGASTIDNGVLVKVLSPAAAGVDRPQIAYTYSPEPHLRGDLINVVDRDGSRVDYRYYQNGRLAKAVSSTLGSEDFAYDDVNLARRSIDAIGNATIEKSNSSGLVIEHTYPDATKWTKVYDSLGRNTQVVDSGLPAINMTYSAKGDLLTRTEANGVTTAYEYDSTFSQVTKITVASVVRSTRLLDAKGNLVRDTDALGNATTKSYDSRGMLIADVDPRGVNSATVGDYETNYVYNGLGQLIQKLLPRVTADVGLPNRPSETLQYDSYGNLQSFTDATGIRTDYVYDLAGRLLSQSLPAPYADNSVPAMTTQFQYDSVGRIIKQIDPRGFETRFEFDANGQVTRQVNPDGSDVRNTYNALGQLIAKRDEVGATTFYEYDSQGRLILTRNPDGGTVKTAYNINNKVASTTAANGAITTFTYNGYGQVTQKTDSLGAIERWTYNARGEVATYVDPLNLTTLYSYDNNGRLTDTKKDTLRVERSTYDAAGDIVAATTYDILGYGNSPPANLDTLAANRIRRTTFEYDAANRLTKKLEPLSTQTLYGYDAAGRKTSETNALGKTTQFVFDLAGREFQTIAPAAAVGQPQPTGTVYLDANGNRIRIVDAAGFLTNYVYDSRNRLIQTTNALSQTATAAYDLAGRVLSTTDAIGRITTNLLDSQGRIVKTTAPDPDATGPLNSPISTFAYDRLGDVIETVDPLGRKTTRTFDTEGRLSREIGPETATASGTLFRSVQYAYNASDELTSSLTTLVNAAGTVLSTTTAAERTVANTYNIFGQLTRRTDVDPDGAGALVAPYKDNTYNGFGEIVSSTDQLNRTTAYQMDGLGQVTRKTLPDPDGAGALVSPFIQWSYDLLGNVTAEIDPRGGVTSFEYDALGRQTKTIAPDTNTSDTIPGATTMTVYDIRGNAVATIDPLGRQTDRTFDPLNRVTLLQGPAPSAGEARPQWTTVFDAAGNIISTTNSMAATTTSVFDNLDRLIAVQLPDPDGTGPLTAPSTQTAYDAAGRTIAITDPRGFVTNITYDAIDREVLRTLPDLDNNVATPQLTIQTAYNDITNTVVETDQLNNTRTTKFDSLGRKISEALRAPIPAESTTVPQSSFTYDNGGDLATTTDALGRQTTFTRDLLGRVTSKRLPTVAAGNPYIYFSYDAANNVMTTTDPLGRVTTNGYDAMNRLVSVTHPRTVASDPATAPVESFTYDLVGNQLTATDALGRANSQTYDNLNRVVTKTLPDPDLTDSVPAPLWNYKYDAAGSQIEQTDPLGRKTTTIYDLLSRATAVILPNPLTGSTAPGPMTMTDYDVAGNITRQTDAGGDVTTFTYDAWNRQILTVRPDPDGAGPLPAASTSIVYDGVGNITSTTDQAGRVTSYSYDKLYRQIGVTLPDPDPTDALPAPTSSSRYDLVGNLIRTTNTLNQITTLDYDALNRLTRKTLPLVDGATPIIDTTYDLVGNVLTTKDAKGRITTSTYDTLDRLLSTLSPDPDGAGALIAPRIDYQYDKVGNVTATTDQLGRVTAYTFDRLDRQTKVTQPDPDGAGPLTAPVTNTVYDSIGNVLAAIDPRGNRSEWTYDNWDRKLTERLPDPTNGTLAGGPQSAWSYDVSGNVLTSTDANGQVTSFTYDAVNRLTQTLSPDPDGPGPLVAPRTINTYNAAGDLASVSQRVSDSVELLTSYVYDAWDRKVQTTDPQGSISKWAYDSENNLKSVTDANLNATTFTYDTLQRLKTETNQLGFTRSFEYDAVGNRTAVVDRNARRSEFVFDALDRVTSEVWKNGATIVRTITTAYNNAGQIASSTDPDSTTTFTYDSLDRLTNLARSASALTTHSFAYAYDAASNLVTTTQTIGADVLTTTRTLDALDRITRIAQTGANVRSLAIDYSYTPTGQTTSVTRYQSTAVGGAATSLVLTTNTYFDVLDREASISHLAGTGSLTGYGFQYDAASRITQISSVQDGTTTYTLDAAGQLTLADYQSRPDETFSYDANGNRTNTGYVTGTNNQALRDGTYAYTYDQEGNRLTRTLLVAGNPTGPATQYTYDHHNRLTMVKTLTAPSGTLTSTTNYSYDTDGDRITRTVDVDGNGTIDTTQRFIVDGDDVTAVVNQSGVIQNRYLHGAAIDEVLAEINPAGAVTWPLADQQQTARDIASFDGTLTSIANHRVFSSFGTMLSQSNAAVDHLFGYTGRELDPQTGLNFYRDRWYDTGVGKFLSEDRLGFSAGDANLTRYVGNSPNDYTDPTGNSWLSKTLGKVKREVARVVDQVKDVVHDAVHDIGEFVGDHPVLAGLAAAATGTWFVAASGGFAGAIANIGKLVGKAVGSIAFDGYTASSSGIGGTYSVSAGSFATVSAGAGVSGTSAFAGVNLSVLGLPVWGAGPTIGVFGAVSDPVASSLVGNFTDALSTNALRGVGSVTAASFATNVLKGTGRNWAYTQLYDTGLTVGYDVATHTTAFAGDVHGAFKDALTLPKPVPATSTMVLANEPVSPTEGFDPETGFTPIEIDPDSKPLHQYFESNQQRRKPFDYFDDVYVAQGVYYEEQGARRYYVERAGTHTNGLLRESGHHYVPWEIITDPANAFSKEVQEVWNAKSGRIIGEWFNTHDSRPQDGISHTGKDSYNKEVENLLKDFKKANDIGPNKPFNKEYAKQFLQQVIDQPTTSKIARFNGAVRAERDLAGSLGKQFYEATKAANSRLTDTELTKRTLSHVSETIVGVKGASTVTKGVKVLGAAAGKVAKPVVAMTMLYYMFRGQEVNAATVNEAAVAMSPFGIAVDGAYALGAVNQYLVDEVNKEKWENGWVKNHELDAAGTPIVVPSKPQEFRTQNGVESPKARRGTFGSASGVHEFGN